MPENYFPDDDDTQPPRVTWRSHANLLYQNRLNYFVYQATPYDLDTIEPVFAGHNTKTARQIHLDERLLRAAFPAAIPLSGGSKRPVCFFFSDDKARRI